MTSLLDHGRLFPFPTNESSNTQNREINQVKTAGIVRKVDQLGRIVLPKALRKRYQMNEGELVEILVQGDRIFLEKHYPKCAVCGAHGMHSFKERFLCEDCMTGMAGMKA